MADTRMRREVAGNCMIAVCEESDSKIEKVWLMKSKCKDIRPAAECKNDVECN